VDHIISWKHGGPTVLENLAYTCIICNRNKGSDVATVNYPFRHPIPLFNPREDVWSEHFAIDDGLIIEKNRSWRGYD
jgi:5-methylcytosine-specific restriction endonuclease McrA